MLLFLSLLLLSLALDLNCLELSSKAKHRVAFILSGSPSHGALVGHGGGGGGGEGGDESNRIINPEKHVGSQ